MVGAKVVLGFDEVQVGLWSAFVFICCLKYDVVLQSALDSDINGEPKTHTSIKLIYIDIKSQNGSVPFIKYVF